jgi:hypothetical protein
MNRPHLGSNSARLIAMLVLGAVYSSWLYLQRTFTGTPRLDGMVGVLLGLFMASHPAGNMLDLLLFIAGDVREKLLTTRAGRAWLALNALVLLASWLVLFLAIMLFVRKTDSF